HVQCARRRVLRGSGSSDGDGDLDGVCEGGAGPGRGARRDRVPDGGGGASDPAADARRGAGAGRRGIRRDPGAADTRLVDPGGEKVRQAYGQTWTYAARCRSETSPKCASYSFLSHAM